MVLLHPLPFDGSVWSDEMRSLGHGVIAPNLYDLGNSLESWASAIVDAAAPGPLVVVGNSIGGSCAIEVARLAPERVKLLVLIGAKAAHRPDPEFRDTAIRLLRDHGMERAWPTYWSPLFAPSTEERVIESARQIAFALPIESIIRGVVAFHARPDRSDFLGQLDVPVLLVNGQCDHIPSDPASLAASLRQGAYLPIEGAGHYPSLERPKALASVVTNAIARLTDYP